MKFHRKRIRHYDEPGHVHELTFSCYQRLPLLTDDVCRELFCEALQAAVRRHHYSLFAYVVMPEHVHLVVQPERDQAGTISDLLRAIKRPSSYRFKVHLQNQQSAWLEKLTIQQRPGIMTFRFWQEGGGYDRNLTKPTDIQTAINYVHENPVRRGLCERGIDWEWSSARHYIEDHHQVCRKIPIIDPISWETFE